MLQVNIILICIIHKILVLLRITTRILKRFLRSATDTNFLKKYSIFSRYIMMESSSLEEENISKDVRNHFRLKRQMDNTAIKDIINIFERKGEEHYYKPVRVSNFCGNNYIEYESKSDRNKAPSVEEYLNKIRSYLKDIIKKRAKSGTYLMNL